MRTLFAEQPLARPVGQFIDSHTIADYEASKRGDDSLCQECSYEICYFYIVFLFIKWSKHNTKNLCQG